MGNIQHDDINSILIYDYQSWSLDTLIDHIEKKHHRYID